MKYNYMYILKSLRTSLLLMVMVLSCSCSVRGIYRLLGFRITRTYVSGAWSRDFTVRLGATRPV